VACPASVIGALRQFLPDFLKAHPGLPDPQRNAIRAISRCRTAALGGQVFACERCGRHHFAFHSCNHKACPQCGRAATRAWVERQLAKRIEAPYFLVTFTLPAQLRPCFLGPQAKEAFDHFFAAVSSALSEKLATDKNLKADVSGFIAVLHTWNQRLLSHPHIHCLVPGAGLNSDGQTVQVKNPAFLVFLPHLQAAFRQHMRRRLDQAGWSIDPIVWSLTWGVHIQPVGSGHSAIKYLGNYVARTAISDSRIQLVTPTTVHFSWKDRADHNRLKSLQLPGREFLERYFQHVLPIGLRSVRYYGFCHPAAKANRLRVQLGLGAIVDLGAGPSTATSSTAQPSSSFPPCPFCQGPTHLVGRVVRGIFIRGPPHRAIVPSTPTAA
jgi:ribosomal protein L37E